MDFERLLTTLLTPSTTGDAGLRLPPAGGHDLPGPRHSICTRFWNDLFGPDRRLGDMWMSCDGAFLEAARDWSVETMSGGGMDAPLP